MAEPDMYSGKVRTVDGVKDTTDDLFILQWLTRDRKMCGKVIDAGWAEATAISSPGVLKCMDALLQFRIDLYTNGAKFLSKTFKNEFKDAGGADKGAKMIIEHGSSMVSATQNCLEEGQTSKSATELGLPEDIVRKNVVDALLTASSMLDFMSAYQVVKLLPPRTYRKRTYTAVQLGEPSTRHIPLEEVDVYRFTVQSLIDQGISYVQLSQSVPWRSTFTNLSTFRPAAGF